MGEEEVTVNVRKVSLVRNWVIPKLGILSLEEK